MVRASSSSSGANASTGTGTSTRSIGIRSPNKGAPSSHLVHRSRWVSNPNATEAAPLLSLAPNINYQSRRSSSITPPEHTSSASTSGIASANNPVFEDDVDEDPAFIKAVYMLSFSILVILVVVFVICVCGVLKIVKRRAQPKFYVTSSWTTNGLIPRKYGCDAEDTGGGPQSIPLWFLNVPYDATNLVILLANADTNKVHWLVTGIPLPISELPANASRNRALMPNAAEEHVAYSACHYRNHTQTYVLNVYAIDGKARIKAYTSASEMMHGFGGVPTARLLGRYGGLLRYTASAGNSNYNDEDTDGTAGSQL